MKMKIYNCPFCKKPMTPKALCEYWFCFICGREFSRKELTDGQMMVRFKPQEYEVRDI